MYENQNPLKMSRYIFFGPGIRSVIGKRLAELGCKKAYVVFDKGVEAVGIPAKVIESLKAAGVDAVTFNGITADPVSTVVDACVKTAVENRVDSFIAVGGGSAIDATKAARAIYVSNPKLTAEEFILQNAEQVKPEIPIVIVPTTAGTGSEATEGAMISVVDKAGEHWKKILECRPNKDIDFSAVDPELTLGTPVRVSMSCAFDVLAHAWEDCVSILANPLTLELAHGAIKYFVKSVNRVHDNINDLDARTDMALGCTMIGIAMNCAYCNAGHAFGHALGSVFNVPHGVACGVFIPAVMEWYADAAAPQLIEIAGIFGMTPEAGENDQAFIARFTKYLYQFSVKVGVDLKTIVPTAEECYKIIPQVLADYSWHIGPKEMTEADAKWIIDKAYSF